MFGIIRKNRQFCSKTRLRKEMIHAAHCLNTIKRKGSKCFSRSIQDFLIIKHMPISGRVGKTCWYVSFVFIVLFIDFNTCCFFLLLSFHLKFKKCLLSIGRMFSTAGN